MSTTEEGKIAAWRFWRIRICSKHTNIKSQKETYGMLVLFFFDFLKQFLAIYIWSTQILSDPVELKKRLKYQNYWNDFTSDINITKQSNQSNSFLFGPIENTSLSPLPVPEIDFIAILLNAFLYQTKGSQYNIYDYHSCSSAHNSLLTNKKAGKYITDLSRPIRRLGTLFSPKKRQEKKIIRLWGKKNLFSRGWHGRGKWLHYIYIPFHLGPGWRSQYCRGCCDGWGSCTSGPSGSCAYDLGRNTSILVESEVLTNFDNCNS